LGIPKGVPTSGLDMLMVDPESGESGKREKGSLMMMNFLDL